jgi:glycosyltransferase involved in cell wall biosynthesis
MPEENNNPALSNCRAVVIWIDWYSYHLARFRGLQTAFGSNGEVYGIELVGGIGVHKGYNFREGVPRSLPVETLFPHKSWHEAGKLSLSVAVWHRLSALNPEMVLVPGYYTLPAITAAAWCRVKGRVSVLMTETTAADHARKGWRERLKSLLIRSLFGWAVTGGVAHERYLLQLGFPQNRIVHFYDVVGNSHIQQDVQEIRERTSVSQHALPEEYFLFVGRLAPEKNVLGLLEAWLQYRASGGRWSLVLAGDGPDGEALKKLVSDSPYANDVRFMGHRSSRELLPAFAFAKTFVLPSTREPWGLVVNEAMAANLPVIVSSRCGCAEDLVRHGDNGFLFNPTQGNELVGFLTAMSCCSDEERTRMGRSSLQHIARFTPQNLGQQIVAIADSVKRTVSGSESRATTRALEQAPSRGEY